MALMIANTLRNGLRGGLVTLAGTTTGLALLVAAAAAGMTSIMVFMSTWFDVVRWAGAIYLVYLGARQLVAVAGPRCPNRDRCATGQARQLVSAGPDRKSLEPQGNLCSWARSSRSSSTSGS